MKRFINTVHYVCIAFTFVTLSICVTNLLIGNPVSISGGTIALNLILILSLLFTGHLLGRLNLKNRAMYLLLDITAKYAVAMSIYVCFLRYNHFPIAQNLLWSTLLYAAVYASSYFYLNKKAQINAAEINHLLNRHNL